ncbi:DNA polymerase III subunit chi [Pseudaquabacterium rugosum]|uniref:DNA polymerase III subunit chi n=1 Tax=Pseudaquabacterium rugosum TaxID=2984194 RepID=A0ABU9BBL1_9BURK
MSGEADGRVPTPGATAVAGRDPRAGAPGTGREIEFHLGVADKFDYACRLLRKIHARQLRCVVIGDARALTRLDAQLWSFDPQSFLPHMRLRAGQAIDPVLVRTPLWLADEAAVAGPADVLLNLGPQPADPQTLAQWARVVELVGDDEADLQAARQRWRLYRQAGHAPRDMRRDAGAGTGQGAPATPSADA